jgi:hypothetical protein
MGEKETCRGGDRVGWALKEEGRRVGPKACTLSPY